MVLNIDLCPTLLDLAGVEIPKTVHGRSLLPLLEGQTHFWRRWFLYEYFREPGYIYWPTIQALRTEEWKYIHYPESESGNELYNLLSDPGECKNLVPGSANVTPDKSRR